MENVLNAYHALPQNLKCAEQHLQAAGNTGREIHEASGICCAVLDTLSVYVEWVSMSHVLERDSLLLQMLCTMLRHDPIQLAAAECLLLITNRKVRVKERFG